MGSEDTNMLKESEIGLLLQRKLVGSSHGAQPNWPDPNAPLDKDWLWHLATCFNLQGQKVAPASWSMPQPCIRTHLAHSQVPRQWNTKPKHEPAGASAWRRSQGWLASTKRWSRPLATQWIRAGGISTRVPAGQRLPALGIPLQAHTVPQEALGPQEGRQFCWRAPVATQLRGPAMTIWNVYRKEKTRAITEEKEEEFSLRMACPDAGSFTSGKKGQGGCRTGCWKTKAI